MKTVYLIRHSQKFNSYGIIENSDLKQISEEGLHPIIGENAMGIEKNPKIFFSKGEIGILKVTEVWARWLMNRIFGVQDRLGLKANL